ncbi:MAG: diacylglycerol kinase family lipid kinase [Ruminococcus sp.]|nr:diacylglycerol kinase family lipid kinase [Ruminococcus sp.]
MEYIFIVNPKSRSGRGGVVWKLVEPELKKRRIEYQVFYTRHVRHAAEITAGITADGREHTLVVVGGDGTVDEVVNGIRDCSKVTLGYIPTGSGNDFTRALHLPSDTCGALDTILDSGRPVPMDVGRLDCGENAWRFAVSAGIGFDAAVCHKAEGSSIKTVLNKLGLGKLTYLVTALKWILSERPEEAELRIEGEYIRRFEHTYFIAAMNHPYEGGGFFFCPKARIDDRLLDVIVVSELPKWKILLLLPTAFFGKHVRFRGISIFRCREIEVKTGKRLPIHTDGEPIAWGDTIRASLEPEQIRVIAPPQE